MHLNSACFSKITGVVMTAVLCAVFGGSTLRAQEATATKTALEFEGNKIFSNEELLQTGNKCLADFSSSSDQDSVHDYCLHRVASHMRSKGYLQARLSRARQVPIENGFRTVVSVEEGALFRLGAITIEGARVMSPGQIRRGPAKVQLQRGCPGRCGRFGGDDRRRNRIYSRLNSIRWKRKRGQGCPATGHVSAERRSLQPGTAGRESR